jgi:hypothetical protein
MDHIGIDVHKRESQIYILAEGGEVVERAASRPPRNSVRRVFPSHRVLCAFRSKVNTQIGPT